MQEYSFRQKLKNKFLDALVLISYLIVLPAAIGIVLGIIWTTSLIGG